MAYKTREKSNAYQRMWREKNKDKIKEKNDKNREEIRRKHKLWRDKNKEKLRILRKINYSKRREKEIKYKCENHRRLNEIIEAYGGKCLCCGEFNKEFLTIHHKKGEGNKHRREVKDINRWLKRNKFPKDDFCLLCYNCNCSIGFYGYCPHKRLL